MKKIGITGGIGAGKSYVLNIIKDSCNCVVLRADDVANELKEPGEACYEPIVDMLSKEVLGEGGRISAGKMSEMIFKDAGLLKQVNSIIHPAVKKYIRDAIVRAETLGYDFFFLEAALLIEDHYDEILDEIWYVRAPEEIRICRLMETRDYSRQKAESIISRQLKDEEYLEKTDRTIENYGSYDEVKQQIIDILKLF